MKLRLSNGLTGADLWRKLQKARTVKDLVSDIIDVGKLVTDMKDRSFTDFARDFADLVGVGACVHLVIGGALTVYCGNISEGRGCRPA